MSAKDKASIKILIYENNHGLPGDLIATEEIICKKGHNKTQKYVPKTFLFPKEGIIVGFEWILNETNKYETTYKMINSTVSKKAVCYSPEISGTKEDVKNIIIGSLVNEEWRFETFKDTLTTPAVQIELTN